MAQNVWVIITLFSLALFAVANVVDKILRTKYLKNSLHLLLIFMGSAIVLVPALFFIPLVPMQWLDILLLCIASALWQAGIYPYLESLSIEETSRVIPLWNMTPLFSLILAAFLLGEQLTSLHMAAFVILFLGSILVSIHIQNGSTQKSIWLSAAFTKMLSSCIAYASAVVILKYLLIEYPFLQVFILSQVIGLGIVGVILFSKQQRIALKKQLFSISKQGWYCIALSLTVIYCARLLYNYALVYGPVALISSLDGFQSIFTFGYTLILSWYFPRILKEEISLKTIIFKVVAFVIMGIGLILLYH